MTDSFRPTVLRNKAWDALRDKWAAAVIAYLLVMVISAVCGFTIILAFLVASVICVGAMFFYWDILKGKTPNYETLFEPIKNNYGRWLLGYLLVFIYVILWSLLLYIPGIIKAISYSMTFYIMRENPEMSGEQAIQRSMAMMKGHKMDYFLLMLSFIGWIILAMITFGLGMLFVGPYMQTASAAFYEELKKDFEARQAFGAAPMAA